MKTVIVDGYIINPGDVSWDGFKTFGEMVIFERLTEDNRSEILRELSTADAAMLRHTMIDEKILEACPSLRFVTLTSTGYDRLTPECLRYARERNVTICNVADYGTPAVSQHAFALLLELCNRVGAHDAAVKRGRWGANGDFCFWDYPLTELDRKTIGIIGFGQIGRAVARMAKGFGMHVLTYSAHIRPEFQNLAEYVSMDELFCRSDVISLHCPLKPETKEIINRKSIAKMKDGVFLINTARGGLLCEADVAEALNRGKIGGAGLDVVAEEPICAENPLLYARNCLITPHQAWAPKETRQRLIDCAVENLRSYLEGHPVHVINP